MAHELVDVDEVRALLARARTIAVLGAHRIETRPASFVPAYLRAAGYRVLPVNPRFRGEVLFGEVTRASLAELAEPVDIVDVFRPAAALPLHVDDILAMRPPPTAVWLQLGIENDDVAAMLIAHGIDVVQDRCTAVDHRRFGIAGVSAS